MEKVNFNITEQAAKRISTLLSKEENRDMKLRIEVLGGGCAGFQYNIDFVNNKNNNDYEFEKNGVFVIIDKTSIQFLNSSTLDYVINIGSAAFEIKNPKATSSCGCGNSFSV